MYRILCIFALGTASFSGTYAFVLPRQDATPYTVVQPPAVPSTSSFNWWPYPPGGVTSSTPTPTTTLIPTTTTESSTPSSTPSVASVTNLSFGPTTATSLIRVTALTSLPASASPSSGPPTPYRPHARPFNKLLLIPLCVVAGVVVGFALAWISWRFWEHRARPRVGTTGYAWAYHSGKDTDVSDMHVREKGVDVDMEYGGTSPVLGLGPVRMPSQVSSSGARTWVARAQARKRSGAAGMRLPSASRARGWGHVHDGEEEIAASPLLGSASDTEPELDSRLESTFTPVSSRPSPYPYGDEDEGEDDVPYETVRHKSIRQRIWERLGLVDDAGVGRTQKRGKDSPGGNPWSGRENQRVNIERSTSLWGRTKSQKRKVERVEQWAQEVGDDMDDKCEAEDAPLQSTKAHLDLRMLRRVSLVHSSSSKDGQMNSDVELPRFLGAHAMAPMLQSSSQSNDTVPPFPIHTLDPPSAQPRVTQRRSSRTLEGGSRGVSLQDTEIVSGSRGPSKFGSKNLPPPPRDASPSRSNTFVRTSSPRNDSRNPGPAPLTPSSVSQYTATPRTTDPAQSVRRAPKHTLTRYARAPASNVTPPFRISAATPPSRGGNGAQTVSIAPPAKTRTRPPSLPAGPPLLMSPPLQSELAFEDIPCTPPTPIGGPRDQGNRPLTPQAQNNHTRRSLPPTTPAIASGSRPPHIQVPSRSSRSIDTKISRSLPSSSRPLSPKERYLARQGANERVGMILSRSYSSRNFEEDANSPNMFGAVVHDHVGPPHPNDAEHLDGDSISEGIEQRLDMLRRYGR